MRRVVVTGLGAITAIGNDVSTFWQSLIEGRCGIDTITKIDVSTLKVSLAAEVKDFDPLLYMEKSEVRKTDLFTQYAIASAAQAVEDSGIVGTVDPYRFGVYFGTGIGGMNTLTDTITKYNTGGGRKVSPFFIPMLISNMAAGAIAIRYSAKGPCLPVVTACATSTNSIGEAFRAIKFGFADAIITGGTEATINPVAMAGFENMMALYTGTDKSAASTPFDKRRSGFVMGEGSGALILEEYERAVKRGAKIYAEVKGYGSACDAYHITAPDPDGEGARRAMALAMEEGNLLPSPDMYINAHGTSTPLNDETETKAIKALLGDVAYEVAISSTKSMTGHALGASGAIEAIAAILALKEGIIPPTIGLEENDPICDLHYVPNKAIKKDITVALSNSIGFGGHNACVAFQKLP